MPDRAHPGLIADIGGTRSRLAVVRADGSLVMPSEYHNRDYPGLEPLLRDYLQGLAGADRPRTAALAVAAPILGERVRMTNLGWEFTAGGLARELGLEHCRVVNDFLAVALAIPWLEATDIRPIGMGKPETGQPVAVLGPGTGLGMAVLVPRGGEWIPVAGEGGHVTLAAVTEQEQRVIAGLRARYGHVSAERLVSGPGLALLYEALGGAGPETPDAVTDRAASGADPAATAAVQMFLELLGTVAGNLALTVGARGGVYLAGGILPRIHEQLDWPRFRERFVDKGRYRDYLEAVPTRLITRDNPALLGLRHYLRQS